MGSDYLRISVTDRCNLRCIYCNPLGDCGFIEPAEILRFEEIERIVKLFSELGVRKVRLTGGEPLVRKNIVKLVEKISSIEAIEDLALTTNGVLLAPLAEDLKAAGLGRVNISVDSAERESYKEITGFDQLDEVTRGIYKALEVGLSPVKINAVIIRGINENQAGALAELSVKLPVTVRFIEYCPTNKNTRPASDFVANKKLLEYLKKEFGDIYRVESINSNGPATYYTIRDSVGRIGFISGRTTIFCNSCNRLRLTSDGKVMPCLYAAEGFDVKKLLREGADNESILEAFKNILEEKHKHTKLNSGGEEFVMRNIGG
jgi:cyclic pyranopterin phosphate synthase